MVRSVDPALVFLCETWLSGSLPDSVVDISGFSIYRADRVCGRGGGVCVYLNNSFFDSPRVNCWALNTPGCETLCLVVKTKNQVLTFCCVYRPPSSSVQDDAILFREVSAVIRNRKDVVVIGDFNFPGFCWPDPEYPSVRFGSFDSRTLFLDFVFSCGLRQVVDGFTRYRVGTNPSLLDLIFVSDWRLLTKPEHLPPIGKSDHEVLLCYLQVVGSRGDMRVEQFRRINFEELDYNLQMMDWELLFSDMGLDEQWLFFVDTVESAIGACSETIPVRFNPLKPWISGHVLNKLKYKKILWRRFKRTGGEREYAVHRKFSNSLARVILQAKTEYEGRLIASGNKNKLFKYVRNAMTSNVHTPRVRDHDGLLSDNDLRTAEIFSQFFETNYVVEPDGAFPDPGFPRNNFSLENIVISRESVFEKLSALPRSSSSVPGGLPAVLLRRCAFILSLPLSLIMQRSMNTSALPGCWKSATVIAIHKKDDKLNPKNYRQIILTPVEVKVMERVIVDCMLPFLLHHRVIPDQQHGFLPGRSTTTNLLMCLDDWTRSLDEKLPTDVIYLDFSKAFDRVPIRRLVCKLERAGIRGRVLGWIVSYLSDRKFKVRVGNDFSGLRPVVSGVPQGSVIGPLLFLIYTCDLGCSLLSCFSQYADDTKLYGNPMLQHHILQDDLDTVVRWCSDWMIPLNADKCAVLRIGKNNPRLDYTIDGVSVGSVSRVTDLGVVINSDLVWSDNIVTRCSKAKYVLYLLKRIFSNLDVRTSSILYKTYVRPVLEYGFGVWCPTWARDFILVESVQRAATRLPYGRQRPSYLSRLNIFDLSSECDRLVRGDLIITYRLAHSLFSVDLSHLLRFREDDRLRGNGLMLAHENYRSRAREFFLSNRVFNVWNSLPREVVGAPSVNSFKARLDDCFLA